MKVIIINNISRKFLHRKKVFYALRNVSFDIKKAEIFGLLGPNGAGKTTLINILIGILTPTTGKASIFGLDIIKDRYDILQIINSASGESVFHWILTVKQILNFFGSVYGLNGTQRKKKIDYLIDRFEIKNLLDKRFGWLSSGEKMRVILAKSLINDPKFLLLDEPTLGLDPDIAKKTRELIMEIRKELGTTILLTSHYMTEVEQLCDRIAFIDKGRIVDIGKIDKIKSLRFTSFKIMIKLKELRKKEFLKKLGFKITEEGIVKSLKNDAEIPKLLGVLVKNNYDIIDIKIQKPTLEDYFLRMVEER